MEEEAIMKRIFRLIIVVIVLTVLILGRSTDAQIITTIAGSGIGDGKPATEAYIAACSIAFDTEGNLLIADTDHHRIRKIDAQTGIITTIAGTGQPGYNRDNIQATQATLYDPMGVAFDLKGNLYFCDEGNVRIRRIDAKTGLITTVAGNGKRADTIVGTPALKASFQTPTDVAVDADGNIYVSTYYIQNAIWKINAKTGLVEIFAGDTAGGIGNFGGFGGDDGPAVNAKLSQPYGIALDKEGNLYIADMSNHRVRKVDAKTKRITTVAGNGRWGFGGDGGKATKASLYSPQYVHVDSQGNLYISDWGNCRVRKVSSQTGIITTVAGTMNWGFNGDNIPAIRAELHYLKGLTTDVAGNLYIADWGNGRIRKVDGKTGIITTFAGRAAPDKVHATESYLRTPTNIATDSLGNLYIATFRRVRKVDAQTGIITSLRLSNDYPKEVTVDSKDNLYVVYTRFVSKVNTKTGKEVPIAGDGGAGFGGDNVKAVRTSLNGARDIAFDSVGNLYIADSGNHRIRKVDFESGIITTVAGTGNFGFDGDGVAANKASLAQPYGIAIDSKDNLYIADTYNHRVRKVDTKMGIITTIAGNGPNGAFHGGFAGDGGPATESMLDTPIDLAFDGKDNLYIADKHNNRIRRIDAKTGIITTIAGNGEAGFSGDGGDATEAKLSLPEGIWIDLSGNLYIADTGNNRIRLVKGVATPMAVSPRGKQPTTLAQIKRTALMQNFPNPFNSETWIPYQLAEDSSVTLTIYNAKGQYIRTISLGKKTAGVYKTKKDAIHWDGRNDLREQVSSGIYFYTLQASEYMASGKMLLIK